MSSTLVEVTPREHTTSVFFFLCAVFRWTAGYRGLTGNTADADAAASPESLSWDATRASRDATASLRESLRLRFGADAMAVGTASPKVAEGSVDESTATSRVRFTIPVRLYSVLSRRRSPSRPRGHHPPMCDQRSEMYST